MGDQPLENIDPNRIDDHERQRQPLLGVPAQIRDLRTAVFAQIMNTIFEQERTAAVVVERDAERSAREAAEAATARLSAEFDDFRLTHADAVQRSRQAEARAVAAEAMAADAVSRATATAVARAVQPPEFWQQLPQADDARDAAQATANKAIADSEQWRKEAVAANAATQAATNKAIADAAESRTEFEARIAAAQADTKKAIADAAESRREFEARIAAAQADTKKAIAESAEWRRLATAVVVTSVAVAIFFAYKRV